MKRFIGEMVQMFSVVFFVSGVILVAHHTVPVVMIVASVAGFFVGRKMRRADGFKRTDYSEGVFL